MYLKQGEHISLNSERGWYKKVWCQLHNEIDCLRPESGSNSITHDMILLVLLWQTIFLGCVEVIEVDYTRTCISQELNEMSSADEEVRVGSKVACQALMGRVLLLITLVCTHIHMWFEDTVHMVPMEYMFLSAFIRRWVIPYGTF